MAFTNKLDTSVVTLHAGEEGIVTSTSDATIELASVVAYNTWIRPDGEVTEYTQLFVTGAGPIVVTNDYAAIDTLINP